MPNDIALRANIWYNDKKAFIGVMEMLSFFIGLIGSLIALIGWFAFDSIIALIIGVLLYVIETIIEWRNLNTGAKIVDIIIFIIGSIVALFIETPFYIGGMIAIAIYSGIMALLSLPMIIQQLKFVFRK